MVKHPLKALYRSLLDRYGPQGWWPLLACRGGNPTKTGRHQGYHPHSYGLPDTEAGRFEVAVGAVLTQNTAWTNAERALCALAELGALSPETILDLSLDGLRKAIRPAGYYNTKTKKLRCLAEFARARRLAKTSEPPTRDELLAVWGIGPETADSIRLYAYHCPEMVVDSYTRRILAAEGLCNADCPYETLKGICVAALPATVPDYQEFHALMVEHGKRRKPSAGRAACGV